jgi:peptidoglycan/xylan/chitin deacetylase (PgdA/CDA1 family)
MTALNRRTFLKTAALAACTRACGTNLFAGANAPQVAITMDDPTVQDMPGMAAAEVNARILSHLNDAKIKAALFVCGMRVDNDAGRKLLAAWNDAGHVLGNHTYSHRFFPSAKMTLADFEADSARGEQVVSPYSRFRKIFRFPFFKEGDTKEKRDGMRAWLKKNGYTQGRATIDASDWAIDARLLKKLRADPSADTKPYRDFYLQHIWERAQYYDGLARKVIGHSPRHTLLVHHSLLNAMVLGDLLAMFRQRGWQVIDVEDAYHDPIYAREPDILPAGESLIWGLAKESGRFEKELRYPGEDDVYENPAMDKLNL